MHATATTVLAAFALAVSFSACRSDPKPASRATPNGAGAVSLVVAEQAGGETAFWSIPLSEPSDRRLIARVAHDPDWGVRATLAPDGRRIAYTFMPPGARSPDRDAALAVLDPATRRADVLARGLDLRTAPVWTSDAGPIVAQRAGPNGSGELVRVGLDRAVAPALAAGQGQRLVPVGPLPDRSGLLVVEQGAGGTRLLRLPDSGAAVPIATLADGPARGFLLAPDGASLAFLRLGSADGRYQAASLDLRSGAVRPIRPDHARLEDTGVLWSDGWLVTAATEDGEGLLLGPDAAHDRTRPGGFDAPAAQDASGGWLALRSFSGRDARDPGAETLTLLDRDGRRKDVEGGGVAVGWSRS
jgi:hypothetical protein